MGHETSSISVIEISEVSDLAWLNHPLTDYGIGVLSESRVNKASKQVWGREIQDLRPKPMRLLPIAILIRLYFLLSRMLALLVVLKPRVYTGSQQKASKKYIPSPSENVQPLKKMPATAGG